MSRSRSQFVRKISASTFRGAISDAAVSKYVGKRQRDGNSTRTDVNYWRRRLLLRRYRFPASSASENDLAAFVDHANRGYYFPLYTSDLEVAATKACHIYQMATKRGWTVTCQHFSRELILSFEWCINPVLWTYTTIHTLPGRKAAWESVSAPADTNNRQHVLVMELDAGIRRALCWSIDHQGGFVSVPCNSADVFAQTLEIHKPRIVFLNRNLAGCIGFKCSGTISLIEPGIPVITYALHVDGDHMFVSTPGGAVGYVVKRVKPDRLLDPMLKAPRLSGLTREDLLLHVKYYFQGLLQLPSGHENLILAKLTPREREVMQLLSRGCVDKEIAEAMGLSIWTVHGYVKHIFKQLHVHTRTEAVLRYLEK